MTDNSGGPQIGRRNFLGAATLGTGAALVGLGTSGAALAAGGAPAPQVDFPNDGRAFGGGPAGTNNRAEIDLYDCEVEGHLPTDIDGVFYRVGPDPQYPKPEKYQGDIPFAEMVSHTFRVDDAAEAIEIALDPARSTKVLITNVLT